MRRKTLAFQLLNALRHAPRRTLARWFPRAPWIARRAFMAQQALEHAFEQLAAGPWATPGKPRHELPSSRIRANELQCGPLASLALQWLEAHQIRGFKLHSLRCHYVLRDRWTGRLHDLECPAGCLTALDLPLLQRILRLAQPSADVGAGFVAAIRQNLK